MAAKKGHPKYGGRKKGTPNKTTLPLEEKARELGVDPFEILLRFAAGDWEGLGYDAEIYHQEKPDGSVRMGYVITPNMRLTAAGEACQYIYPKRKAVELKGNDDDSAAIQIVIKDYGSKS